jgi:nucleoside-diphosphate-sugar epimerase
MKDRIRLCVTGGSGFIGTNLIDRIDKEGISVINIDINPPKIKGHTKYWRKVNILDLELFKNTILDYDPTHIINLAATTGVDDAPLSHFLTNIDGVNNLVSIAKNLKNLDRIIFTSSLLVCKNGYIPIDDLDYCPPNPYGQSKAIGESIVRKRADFDWVIVRPTAVWGPWFQHSYKTFFNSIIGRYYFHAGTNEIIKPQSYVGNTVHMLHALVFSKNLNVSNKTFYLLDFPAISTRAWADQIAHEVGNSRPLTCPIFVLKIFAKIGDCLKYFGWSDPVITSFRLNNMLTGANYPDGPIRSIVCTLPFSVQMGIRETVRWMNDCGED